VRVSRLAPLVPTINTPVKDIADDIDDEPMRLPRTTMTASTVVKEGIWRQKLSRK
jgi:hypothetical protein